MTTPDHTDPGPRPYNDDEWAPLAAALANHPATASVAVAGNTLARLVDTVDTLTAERDAAREDRVCWRETHNQVAARLAQAETVVKAADDLLSNGPIDGPGPWLGPLEVAVRTYHGDPPGSGTPGEDTDTPADKPSGYKLDGAVVMPGPATYSTPAEPVCGCELRNADEIAKWGHEWRCKRSKAPAEPVCTTCNGDGEVAEDTPWMPTVETCPACLGSGVGDLPGDTGDV